MIIQVILSEISTLEMGPPVVQRSGYVYRALPQPAGWVSGVAPTPQGYGKSSTVEAPRANPDGTGRLRDPGRTLSDCKVSVDDASSRQNSAVADITNTKHRRGPSYWMKSLDSKADRRRRCTPANCLSRLTSNASRQLLSSVSPLEISRSLGMDRDRHSFVIDLQGHALNRKTRLDTTFLLSFPDAI
jgi:hypothetical protein